MIYQLIAQTLLIAFEIINKLFDKTIESKW